ncbi:MAG: ComF family protein [Candidatus Nealsonbacteria bacterium]|nr:ComF family protein [Candidatus Nealsonbacteria bacterium]
MDVNNLRKLKALILDILYPKFCVNCAKEGFYLCEDCLSLVEILDKQYCSFCFPARITIDGKTCPSCEKGHYLNGLYFACSYENPIIKKLISEFKYEPYIKDYAELLAFFIISHLANLNKTFSDFKEFIIIPVPLFIKKQKIRGYNQAEEIGKKISEILKIQLLPNVLIKTKPTISQTELKKEERIENIRNSFLMKDKNPIKDRDILLIDDVFTSGGTMDECARILKQNGAKEVWGMAIARGN